MPSFGNVCTITYLSDCAPDEGATSVIPETHAVRLADGSRSEYVRRPVWSEDAAGMKLKFMIFITNFMVFNARFIIVTVT